VGIDRTNGRIERNSTRQNILKEFDDSLRRLQTDYIDVCQVHWPDPQSSVEETASTFRELYEQGKIRAIGVSNYSADQVKQFQAAAPYIKFNHLIIYSSVKSSTTSCRTLSTTALPRSLMGLFAVDYSAAL